MTAGAWRTPIGQNAHEPAALDISFHKVHRQMCKPEPFQGRMPYQGNGVEHEPPLDANP